MPTYRVNDNMSGVTLDLTGDSPPTDAELTNLFSKYQKPKTTALGAFGRAAATGVVPAAGAWGGFEAGAMAGAAIPGLGETGIPELIGGGIGALVGSVMANKAQKAALKKVAPDVHDTLEKFQQEDLKEHPMAAAAGSLASNLPVFQANPLQTMRGASALVKIAKGQIVTATEKQAAKALAVQSGYGVGMGVVAPLVQGQKPTAGDITQSVATMLLFGNPRLKRPVTEPTTPPTTPKPYAIPGVPTRGLPAPRLPEPGRTLPRPTVPGTPAEPRETSVETIRRAQAKTKEQIQKLFPQANLSRQKAAELRDLAWGKQPTTTTPQQTYAREIQTPATVHGDLRPQPVSGQGPVPVPESGGRIQPQAEGRLPQTPPGQVPLTPPEPTPEQFTKPEEAFASKGVTRPSISARYFHEAGEAAHNPEWWVNLFRRLTRNDFYPQETAYQIGLYLRQLGDAKAGPVLDALEKARTQISQIGTAALDKFRSAKTAEEKNQIGATTEFKMAGMAQFPREAIEAARNIESAVGMIPESAAPPLGTSMITDTSKHPMAEFPVEQIKFSKDVPNFKADADPETGVVPSERLTGKYQRLGTAPIVLWERLNGDHEIITGRHRLDLARSSGEKTIPVQIVREADGFTKEKALTFDAESNIRDGQGTIEDYAHYFKNTPDLTESEAGTRGLLDRVKGQDAFRLARSASDDLYSLWSADKIPTEKAVAIARAAPGNADLQVLGIKQAFKDKSPDEIENFIKAVQIQTGGTPEQVDLFGRDDTAIKQAEEMAARATEQQNQIAEQIRAVQGAVKRPELARKLGVDVRDPEGVIKRIGELKADLERWKNWPVNPDLVAQVGGKPLPPAPAPPAAEAAVPKAAPGPASPAAPAVPRGAKPAEPQPASANLGPGLGAAKTGEVATGTGADITGIAQRVREKVTQAGQEALPPTGEGINAPDSVEHGEQLLAKGADPEKAVANFEKTKRFSADDIALVRAQLRKLAFDARRVEEKSGTESREYLAAWKARSDWAARIKPMQTEWSKSGQAQQGEQDIDTGTFTGLREAYTDDTGKDFTPQQADTAKKIAGKGKAITADVESAKQKLYTRLGREAGGTDAEKQAIAAAHKTVREAAARMSEAENKVRVADQALANERANVQEQAKNKALAATSKTVREAAVRKAKAESKQRVAQALRDKRTAQVQAKVAKKTLDAANKVVLDAAARTARAEVDARVNPEKQAWAKVKTYLDEGEKDFDDIRNKVATDLGMPVKKVTDLLTRSKRLKYLADDVWKKQQAQRRFQEQAKRWLKQTAMPAYQRALQAIPRILFGLKVGFHGTVALGTHAPTVAFQPRFWNAYVRDFGKMYRMVGSPAYYEMQVQDLLRRPNYLTARRAGLINDPFQWEDYNSPDVAQYIGRLSGMGNRGYSVLKILRQDMFDQHWNNLPQTARTPEVAQAIANGLNHATGVVKVSAPKGANIALFAPRLEMSRAAWLVTDPIKAADTFARWKTASEADKTFAVNQVKEKAWVAGTLFGMLALNQGFLSATDSKQKINLSNPMKSDFLKFKAAGMDFSYGNAMLSMMRLPVRLYQIRESSGGKLKNLIYPDEDTYNVAGQYVRSQLSPFASLASELWLKADYENKPLPGSTRPVPKRLRAQGVQPYTWPEFWSEQLTPIPVEEALKEVWQQGLGMSPEQMKAMRKAMATVAVMGATGARLTDDVSSKPQTSATVPPPWAANAP